MSFKKSSYSSAIASIFLLFKRSASSSAAAPSIFSKSAAVL